MLFGKYRMDVADLLVTLWLPLNYHQDSLLSNQSFDYCLHPMSQHQSMAKEHTHSNGN